MSVRVAVAAGSAPNRTPVAADTTSATVRTTTVERRVAQPRQCRGRQGGEARHTHLASSAPRAPPATLTSNDSTGAAARSASAVSPARGVRRAPNRAS